MIYKQRDVLQTIAMTRKIQGTHWVLYGDNSVWAYRRFFQFYNKAKVEVFEHNVYKTHLMKELFLICNKGSLIKSILWVVWHADRVYVPVRWHSRICLRIILFQTVLEFHHEDVTWDCFPHYWPFVTRIHRSLVAIDGGAPAFSLQLAWMSMFYLKY